LRVIVAFHAGIVIADVRAVRVEQAIHVLLAAHARLQIRFTQLMSLIVAVDVAFADLGAAVDERAGLICGTVAPAATFDAPEPRVAQGCLREAVAFVAAGFAKWLAWSAHQRPVKTPSATKTGPHAARSTV
jgi:hypothetical protein